MLIHVLSSISTGWLLGGIIALIILYMCMAMKKRPEMSTIPGYWTPPVLGLLLRIPYSLSQVIPTIVQWVELFPDICYGHVLNYHYVMLSSAKAVEEVLTSREILDKGRDYEPMHPWFGQGLLTSYGRRWQRHRKLLTPAFHFAILDRFLEVMNDHADVLINKLTETKGKVVDVWPMVANATLDVICDTAMGVKTGAQLDSNSKYIQTVKKTTDAIFIQTVRPWLRWKCVRTLLGYQSALDKDLAYLLDFSRGVISRRRSELQINSSKGFDENMNEGSRLAFLDLLLEAAEKDKTFTEDDIREEVDTFMFEGHDTTTSGINWAIYNIGRSERVQRLIHAELDNVLGSDISLRPTREQLGQLRYLECAIKESLRLFPPVTFFSRRVKSPTTILGHTISADTDVVINTFGVHRDPTHWKQPNEFIPERFLPEESRGRHVFCYIPFSAGPRNCIGQKFAMMEMKTVMVSILRSFRIICREPEDVVIPATRMSLTLQKDGPLLVQFVARESFASSVSPAECGTLSDSF